MHFDRQTGLNALITLGSLCGAALVSFLFNTIAGDSDSSSVPVFILAVALTARYTSNYFWGILASAVGMLCVNFLFTYPYLEFNLTMQGYPLLFASMLIVSILISALTTRIKAQDQLRLDMAKETLRANLLRAISHDIRTPLTSILGSSSAILENCCLPEEERTDLVREISKDAQWLIHLTENILSVTRFSGDDVHLHTEPELIEEIVSSAIVKFRKKQSGVTLSVHSPDDVLFVPADATLIEQVLLNLFENSVTHGGASRIDVIISHEPGSLVCVSVEDNGSGIRPAILPRIFDLYVRAEDPSSGSDRRSMGIGLSVCRSIIRAHNGEITAENRAQGGARMRFTLPEEKGS